MECFIVVAAFKIYLNMIMGVAEFADCVSHASCKNNRLGVNTNRNIRGMKGEGKVHVCTDRLICMCMNMLLCTKYTYT